MTLEKLRRVLLVEDNLGDARLVREMLIDAPSGPFQVQTVETLVAALDALAREDRFDVVLLDLSLPDSTVLDTLLTVERHAMGVPIVLLTGLDNDSIALDAVRRGAQDYLLKGTLSPEILVR